MAIITPGIDFIAIHTARMMIPSFLTCFSLRFLSDKYDTPLPTWVVALASTSTFPLILAMQVIMKKMRNRRLAAAQGARLVPTVKGKLFGNLDVLIGMNSKWETGYLADVLNETHQVLGPIFNPNVVWNDNIFITSPEHLKLILATDFNNYVKGQRLWEQMSSLLGSGVFNSDGDMWKFHRSITRPAFTRNRISDFDIFDGHAKTAISLMKDPLRAGYSVNFQDLISRFTLDSASEFLFGDCLHTLTAGLPYAHNVSYIPPNHTSVSPHVEQAKAFSHAFASAQAVVFDRIRFTWVWPLFELWEDKTKKHMKVVHAYVDPIVKRVLEKKKAAPKIDEKGAQRELKEGETLLEHLAAATDDHVLLRDETLNIMIAGRDTTATALTFVVYLLSMHPEVLTRLREEILAKVGPTRRPDFDAIKDMKYLRAVINETLRLFPPVPLNTKAAVNDTIWPSPTPGEKPIFIPGGARFVFSVFLMHRRKDLWGPDAEEFDPDRFLDERLQKYLMKNPFIFLPFNAGPRICLGQQFAYNEVSFMLIHLLQSFKSITLDEEACPPEHRPRAEWKQGEVGRRNYERIYPRTHLTMYVAGGLWVKMEEADYTT